MRLGIVASVMGKNNLNLSSTSIGISPLREVEHLFIFKGHLHIFSCDLFYLSFPIMSLIFFSNFQSSL